MRTGLTDGSRPMIAVAMAATFALLAAAATPAVASAPKAEHTITVGLPAPVSPFGSSLSCPAGSGGCSVFSPGGAFGGGGTGFIVPEHGGVYRVDLGVEPGDSFSYLINAATGGGGTYTSKALLPTPVFGPTPWGVIAPGAARVASQAAPDDIAFEVLPGETLGLNALGAQGPSLDAVPGQTTHAFSPAFGPGSPPMTAGGPETLADLQLQMRVIVEREAALRLHSVWAFPNPMQGFRQDSKFKFVAWAQNTSSKAAARDVEARIALSNKAFAGIAKDPCGAHACIAVGSVPATSDATAPFLMASEEFTPRAKGKGTLTTTLSTKTIEDDLPELANNSGSLTLKFKRKRKGGGGEDPPACGTLRLGSDQPDVLTGANGSDLMIGFGADDKLKGKGGDDCIAGGEDNDVMVGAGGNDILLGDGGDDTAKPGKGRDWVELGEGDDVAKTKDGKKDYVDCGPDKDKVVADKKDKVANNCEKVKRK